MKYLKNLDYVLIWRIFLGLVIASILAVITYEEVKTTVTYSYTPSGENRFTTKRYNNPNDSPIVLKEGERLQLINQPSTPFTATLTDIFETLKVKVFYKGSRPTQVGIRSEKSQTPRLIDPGKINIYERLEEKGWVKETNVIQGHPELVLYHRPKVPEFFDPFEFFLSQKDKGELIERIYNLAKPTIWVVKNDSNVQHQSLANDDHDINFFQYVLLPESIQDYKKNGIGFVENVVGRKKGDLYVASLEEKLWEEVRERGAEYKFRIKLDNYQPGDWAVVEKIEITATRKPVTLESFKNFLGRKRP